MNAINLSLPVYLIFQQWYSGISTHQCAVTTMKLGFLNGMRRLSHKLDQINHSNVHFMLCSMRLWIQSYGAQACDIMNAIVKREM